MRRLRSRARARSSVARSVTSTGSSPPRSATWTTAPLRSSSRTSPRRRCRSAPPVTTATAPSSPPIVAARPSRLLRLRRRRAGSAPTRVGTARRRPATGAGRRRPSRDSRPPGARARAPSRASRSSREALRARRRSGPSPSSSGIPVVAKRGATRLRRRRRTRGSAAPSVGAFRTPSRTVTAAAISIPVPHTSPSPCAKWTSPSESSAPGTCTGRSSVEPATSRRMSRLPPVSRGGIVRSPPAAAAGTALLGHRSATGPPAARIRSSRARCRSISACEGATPITPAWTQAGTATPGSSGDRARRRVELPGDEERLREDVRQEAEAGDHRVDAEVRCLVRDELDLEHVTRLGTLDEQRAGERMSTAEIEPPAVCMRRSRASAGRRGRRGISSVDDVAGSDASNRRRCRGASGCAPCSAGILTATPAADRRLALAAAISSSVQ